MKRIIIVGNLQSALVKKTAAQLPGAMVVDHWQFPVQAGDVLCWLPAISDEVDRDVFQLTSRLDQASGAVSRIVAWSPAGTADDADADQLASWWGPNWRGIIGAYLYAVKMIDELEYPYTIVRSLPYSTNGGQGQVVAEGQRMIGQSVNVDDVARAIAKACRDRSDLSQSIGIDTKRPSF